LKGSACRIAADAAPALKNEAPARTGMEKDAVPPRAWRLAATRRRSARLAAPRQACKSTQIISIPPPNPCAETAVIIGFAGD
jgi:hypothetical protein